MNKQPLEEMAAFFNKRSYGYDSHMAKTVEDFDRFYEAVAAELPSKRHRPRVLDIGCGTGLELSWIWERLPEAFVVCMDVSSNMLQLLQEKYEHKRSFFELHHGSYTESILGSCDEYDAVVSVMTVHHLLRHPKLELYKRIYACLKPGGVYVEGDYVVSPKEEQEMLEAFYDQTTDLEDAHTGEYHLDIPLSISTQRQLFEEAGFASFRTPWCQPKATVMVGLKPRTSV